MNWWVESWLMIFNLIAPMRSWGGFVAWCPVVLGLCCVLWVGMVI